MNNAVKNIEFKMSQIEAKITDSTSETSKFYTFISSKTFLRAISCVRAQHVLNFE